MSDEEEEKEIPEKAYQYLDFLRQTEYQNKYDYDTWKKDMDLSTRHQDYLRKIKKRWMDENKKYKDSVEHMKEFKEEQLQKKTNDLVNRLKEKEKLYLTSFRDKQKSRMKERQKAIDLLMEKERNAREKVNEYMEREEIKRLKLQKTSTDKVKSIEKRNKRIKKRVQDDFTKKNKQSEKRHEDNVLEVKKMNEQLEKETEERTFQKYITYYFLKKGINQSLSKKKKEQSNKLQEKADKLDELERQNDEKRIQLAKKMKKMDNKREEFRKKKEEKIIEDRMKREEHIKKMKENLNELEQYQRTKRDKVLNRQSNLMHKSLNMNLTSMTLKSMYQDDNSITNQIVLKQNEMLFKKKLNELKSQSINKKSPEDKVKMYKDLKRSEAEEAKRKKEEEMFNKGLIK